ncbi:hypothetical protein [Dactylosporangium sp. CA-139066]|uniref:hypothetical protein n=1 Tax=Dactylosporangium sp. CA-139066 TaxID=3239930 RepID=UPI003D9146A9
MIAAERAELAATAARYSVPRHIHPLEGLLEQYAFRMGEVAHLRELVNALPAEALFWGVESETDRRSPDGEDGERLRTGTAAEFERKSKAGPNAILEQYDKAQAAAEKLGLDIIRVGLETAAQNLAGRLAGQLGPLLDGLMAACAAEAARFAGLSEADAGVLAASFRPLAVERIAAFAGARTVDGTVAA